MRIILLSIDCETSILMKILHDYPATRESKLLHYTEDLKVNIPRPAPPKRRYEIQSFEVGDEILKREMRPTRSEAIKFALNQEDSDLQVRVYSITDQLNTDGTPAKSKRELIYKSEDTD